MSDLSVVIVTWNSGKFIGPCLRSLLADPVGVSREVVVVDNASTDAGPERVGREFPQVRLIVNPANLGFAAGCNLGARASRSAYILFLNPDTLIPRGTLAPALAFMAGRPEAGLAGFRTRDAAGRFQRTAFGFPSPLRMFAYVSGLNRVFKLTRLERGGRLRTPDYIQGSFILARRAAFEAVGGFDEDFFMYSEDVDLCLRVRRAGWPVYYAPEPAITHFGGGSSPDSFTVLDRFIRSLFILYRKHRTPAQTEDLRRAVRRGLAIRGGLAAASDLARLKRPARDRREILRRLRELTEDAAAPDRNA